MSDTGTTRGLFIVFEGGEGVGKSTQSRLLADALENRGIATVLTREPGGTKGAEAIRRLLLHPPEHMEGGGWNPRAEALLFAAARSDHVEKLIRPALLAGKWVICDRYLDSSRAYQGGGGGLTDSDILALHSLGSENLLPDVTVLLQAPAEATQERLARRDPEGGDAIEGRDASYHARVADHFVRIAQAEPDRFIRIFGDGSRETTHDRIMASLAPYLGERA